jgi:hypothetical protein
LEGARKKETEKRKKRNSVGLSHMGGFGTSVVRVYTNIWETEPLKSSHFISFHKCHLSLISSLCVFALSYINVQNWSKVTMRMK